MSALLDNPSSVTWSHSDRQADFYELPTDGADLHEALGWLLRHYDAVKLWMGVETEDGAELYLICMPPQLEAVVQRLRVSEDEVSIFDVPAGTAVGQ